MNGFNQPTDFAQILQQFSQQQQDLAKQEAERQALAQQQQEAANVQGAGIKAGGGLVGGLLATKAAQDLAMQKLEQDTAKEAAVSQAQAMEKATQNQQDIFARLMGSFRSALV